MNTVIEIENLTKRYGNNKAVDNISFSVDRGEILGFLGPNGAGKSTTMNMLTGYLSKDSGRAAVCGFDILENPKEVKKRIGYLPEQPPIYMEMTPNEYLLFVCDLKGIKEKRQEHIDSIMETVGILEMKNRLIKNLSKGYKQRVGLAGALVGNPEVLILDEPTVGLDPRQIIEIRNLIKKLGKDKTIILSTHILQEVSAVCDRVVIINRGKIVAEDTLENLSGNDKSHTYILRIKGDRNRINEIVKECEFIGEHVISSEKEPGAFDVTVSPADFSEDIREKLFNLFVSENMPVLSFKKKEVTLEDVFVSVTNQEETEEEEKTEETGFGDKLRKLFVKKEKTETISEEPENEAEKQSECSYEEVKEADTAEDSNVKEEEENDDSNI